MSSHKLISNSSSIRIASRTDELAPRAGERRAHAYAERHTAWDLTVDERFFETLGIKLLRGRTFTPADEGSGPVAVINQALARQFFPTDDTVGRQFRIRIASGRDAPVR